MEFHASGHHRLHADGDLAGGIVGVVVGADDGVHVVDGTGFDHIARAAPGFLGGLEQDLDRPGYTVAMIGQPERRAQQEAHMQVVPAAMHHAVIGGFEVKVGVLLDGQAVDVGSQGDARAGSGSLDQADEAGLQRGVEHFDAVGAQLVSKIGRGGGLLEAAFGVLV